MAKRKKSERRRKEERLDSLLSKWVRQSNSDNEGMVECCTCGVKKHWKELHCGHFQSRRYKVIRWLESNVAPQCFSCNITDQGRQWRFGKFIDKRNSKGSADKLEALAEKHGSRAYFTLVELDEMIEYYKELLTKNKYEI